MSRNFLDRFLHHDASVRVLTMGGNAAGRSMAHNVLMSPDSKLCILFGATAAGIAAAIAPEHIEKAVGGALGAWMMCQTGGRILERMVYVRGGANMLAQNAIYAPYRNYYAIEKAPHASIPIPVEAALRARNDAGRIAGRFGAIASGLGYGVCAAAAYGVASQLGYAPAPDYSTLAPLMGGMHLRFVAAAERFQRVYDGRYSLTRP